MFNHRQEIPLHEVPAIPFLTSVENNGEGKASSQTFTYGVDIPLENLMEG
ncbi:hypothetical protein [Ammoniphilus sp. YIM 78166]|nr:hypothetical protein [Ammoniphilus sp. YIM 78166]